MYPILDPVRDEAAINVMDTDGPIFHLYPVPKPAYVPPTIEIAQAYQNAYDYFNRQLFEPTFGERLPDCVLNLSRKRGAAAFFWADQWNDVKDGSKLAEISMVPEHTNRPLIELMATLCHEKAHFKDFLDGTNAKGGYHGKSWFKIMYLLGLPGKALSKSMLKVTQEIDPDGAFVQVFNRMPKGLVLPFKGNLPPPRVIKVDTMQGKRIKYECPACGDSLRGKSGMLIQCLKCDETFHDAGV